MQTRHVFIAISVICAILLAPATGLAETITWNGEGAFGQWNDGDNWDLDRVPAPGDAVIITTPGKTLLDVIIESHGGSTDGACETLDLSAGVSLLIRGVMLTLGEVDTPTTSQLDGAITFELVGQNDIAYLAIHDWVTFEGSGKIFANQSDLGGPHQGSIIRADSPAGGIGIRLRETIDMIGSLDVWVSVDHQGNSVGVFSEKDVMRFGEPFVDPYDPELEISGLILNEETITASRGKVEFHQIVCASTAPKWLVKGQVSPVFMGTKATFDG